VIEEGSMDYHQSIAATCERTVAALSHTLNTHGYRLERSFDLRRTRQATSDNEFVVLLAYEQGVSAPPVVITAHEGAGLTHLSASTVLPGESLARAVVAAFDEIWDNLA
jgi:hypothetical protein